MNLKLKTPPAIEPVSLDLMKAHLRINQTHEDYYIEHLIKTARAQIELLANRCLVSQLWEVSLLNPSCVIRLPLAPVKKIKSIHIKTPRGDKLSMGLLKATIDNKQDGPVLNLPNPLFGEAIILFEAGYGEDPNFVPEPLKHAILLLSAYYYENRGDENRGLPDVVQHLIQPFIYNRLAF